MKRWSHWTPERGGGAHPAVDDDHVLGVAVQPGLLGLADGAHLIQGWRMQLWPAHVQNLQREREGASWYHLWRASEAFSRWLFSFTKIFHSRVKKDTACSFSKTSWELRPGSFTGKKTMKDYVAPLRLLSLGLICSSAAGMTIPEGLSGAANGARLPGRGQGLARSEIGVLGPSSCQNSSIQTKIAVWENAASCSPTHGADKVSERGRLCKLGRNTLLKGQGPAPQGGSAFKPCSQLGTGTKKVLIT